MTLDKLEAECWRLAFNPETSLGNWAVLFDSIHQTSQDDEIRQFIVDVLVRVTEIGHDMGMEMERQRQGHLR